MDFNEARDNGPMGWHQLDYMQITLLHTDNHAIISSLNLGWMLFLTPNQQCQSTDDKE